MARDHDVGLARLHVDRAGARRGRQIDREAAVRVAGMGDSSPVPRATGKGQTRRTDLRPLGRPMVLQAAWHAREPTGGTEAAFAMAWLRRRLFTGTVVRSETGRLLKEMLQMARPLLSIVRLTLVVACGPSAPPVQEPPPPDLISTLTSARVIELTGSSSEIVHIPYEQAYEPGFEDVFVFSLLGTDLQ